MQLAIPKLDGHYDHWCMLMENFLHSKEYWNLIEQGIPIAEQGRTHWKTKEGNWRCKTEGFEVKNYLFQAIDR